MSSIEPARPAGYRGRHRPYPNPWTPEQIRALGPVTDIATAGNILGLSRSTAYALAGDNTFPVPVLRVGAGYRVPVAALLTALHIPLTPQTPAT